MQYINPATHFLYSIKFWIFWHTDFPKFYSVLSNHFLTNTLKALNKKPGKVAKEVVLMGVDSLRC
jgi:hypothetical protein